MDIKILHPGDDEIRENCSYCNKKFEEDGERINTCDINGYNFM